MQDLREDRSDRWPSDLLPGQASVTEEVFHLIDGPIDLEAYGKDATAWRWWLNGHVITVEIANSAMEAVLDRDSRLARAVESRGGSEVARMLDWDVPNPTVFLSTEALDEP